MTILTNNTSGFNVVPKGSGLSNSEVDNNFYELLSGAKVYGVSAAALHRSPYAVTAMSIYDTSKDSDGGAWTEKCQGTSWYNEALSGNWLGSEISEYYARQVNSTVGAELSSDPELLNSAIWTGSYYTLINGQAIRIDNANAAAIFSAINLTAYKTYRIRVQFTKSRPTFATSTPANYGAMYAQAQIISQAANVTSSVKTALVGGYVDLYITPTVNTTQISIYSTTNSYTDLESVSVKEVTAQTTATNDYFQLTTDGKFYKLNATSGTTEVFRGNKAKFPKMVGIVAEAANVTLYDLTEAGRPMWMRWIGVSASMLYTTPTLSVSALNGKLVFGSNGTGVRVFSMVSDFVDYYTVAMQYKYRGNIAQRNSAGLADQVPFSGYIPNNSVTAVAMTVLPDAPLDPVTGLQVPTIAVATGNGVSVIKHDGTVVTSNNNQGTNNISITPNILTWYNTAYTTNQYALSPGQLQNNFASPAIGNGFNTPNNTGRDSLFKRNLRIRTVSNAAKLTLANLNESAVGKTVLADITSNYNTGHLLGDIRRAYLADSVVESVSGSGELVTNGTFATDISGWTNNVSATWSAGTVLLSATTTSATLSQGVSTVIGKRYVLLYDYVAGNTGNSLIRIGTTGGGFDIAQIGMSAGAGTKYRYVFVATAVVTYINLFVAYPSVSIFGQWDNISLSIADADRSYKSSGATLFGTLTKALSSPSASNQLVAYSGFSAANYLQEPYSSDLDFGLSEWNVSAWVNYPALYGSTFAGQNLFAYSGTFTNAIWSRQSGILVTAASGTGPFGGTTATQVDTNGQASYYQLYQYTPTNRVDTWTYSIYVKAKPSNSYGYAHINMQYSGAIFKGVTINLADGSLTSPVGSGIGVTFSVDSSLGNGWYRLIATVTNASFTIMSISPCTVDATFTSYGDPVFTQVTGYGILIDAAQFEYGMSASAYKATTTRKLLAIANRAYSTGSFIDLSADTAGYLTATAYDGTTTRTATTSTAYNTGIPLNVSTVYRTDGSLSLYINGSLSVAASGVPLLSLSNTSAVLTIGNSYALDAPFPGSIALLKLSATAPTQDQITFMYEQEKQLFRDGAQCLLPDAGAVVDLGYDDLTDKWTAISATNESTWTGLVRTSVTPVPAGSNILIKTGSGIKLNARSTTSPGVDITFPDISPIEQVYTKAISAAKNRQVIIPFDFDTITFSANTTNISPNLTNVTAVSGTPYIGMGINGAGIPAGAVINYIGSNYYLMSANATATTGSVISIGQTTFTLNVGYTNKSVYFNGSEKVEGSTKDYVVSFDGFRETITFNTSPGVGAWVQIQAGIATS